jgi:hypothetical protein
VKGLWHETAATRVFAALLLVAFLVASTGDAAARSRRYRRTRSTSAPKMATLALPPVKPAPPKPAPWARNVLVVMASGYSADLWNQARSDSPGGRLAIDDLTWNGYALNADDSPERVAFSLATGLPATSAAPLNAPRIFASMRQTGRTTGLVTSSPLTSGAVTSFFCAAEGTDENAELKSLTDARVSVLFSRASIPSEDLSAAGYAVPRTPAEVVLNTTLPVAAGVAGTEMMFDALTFQALHLAARNPKGFGLAVEARPETVSVSECNAALTMALAYARKERRTLVLFLRLEQGLPAAVYAYGPGAEKFAGTIQVSDIPKLAAGLAHVPFRRDYSAQYLARRASLAR